MRSSRARTVCIGPLHLQIAEINGSQLEPLVFERQKVIHSAVATLRSEPNGASSGPILTPELLKRRDPIGARYEVWSAWLDCLDHGSLTALSHSRRACVLGFKKAVRHAACIACPDPPSMIVSARRGMRPLCNSLSSP